MKKRVETPCRSQRHLKNEDLLEPRAVNRKRGNRKPLKVMFFRKMTEYQKIMILLPEPNLKGCLPIMLLL